MGLGHNMGKTKDFLLKSLFTLFIVFSAGLIMTPVAHAKSAGTVTFTTGDTSIVRADKSVVKAAKNDAVNAGDTIETKNGRLQLSLIDGGKVSLQPNTVYKINKYEFSGKEDGSEYAFTELLKGGMRTISGLIGHKNRERYQLKTAVATIGIRGTEFTVNFNDNQLLMTTNHGSVDVCNTAGCLNAMTGQSIVVSGTGAAPKLSSKAAKAAATPPDSSKPIFMAADVLEVPVTGIDALASYSGPGFISTVMKTLLLNGVDGVLDVDLIVNADSQPTNAYTAGNAIDIQPASFASYSSDGLVAWGRAYGGAATQSGAVATIEWMDYAVGTKPGPTQLVNLTGTYHVFGSTAPMLLSGGISTVIGSQNAVTGSFMFDFRSYGSYSYNLSVNTVGADYALSGGGSILSAANPTFQTSGIVTSAACAGGTCSAALQGGNNLIQGAFFGPNAERIGLQYGFNAPTGQIFGTAVLK